MKTVSVKVDYQKQDWDTEKFVYSHSYTDQWEKTKLFCLSCGKQGVYREKDCADYETGDDYICTHCSIKWTMWPAEKISSCPYDTQKLEQLIAARIKDENEQC